MAGKYHRDYEHYAVAQDGHVLVPGQKAILAYAEGYNAYRSGAAKANPHAFSEDDESDFQSWEYGWQDGTRGSPPTHVGGPQAIGLSPPANTASPTIHGAGNDPPLVGDTLTIDDPGTWTGDPAPSFTYQWLRNAAAISGATGQVYTLVAADEGTQVMLRITATNSEGSANASSNMLGPVGPAP